ncbi:MAG: hypothetical protein IPP77_09810 [Bacteroidetes bacterium]|nr:hypothetical protein [Bacteroidota bacterium]
MNNNFSFSSQTPAISADNFCVGSFAFARDGESLNHRFPISKQSVDFIHSLFDGVKQATKYLKHTNGCPIGTNGSTIGALDAVIGVPDSVIGALGAVIGVPDSVIGALGSVIGAPDSVIGANDTANGGLKSLKRPIFLLKSINSIH